MRSLVCCLFVMGCTGDKGEDDTSGDTPLDDADADTDSDTDSDTDADADADSDADSDADTDVTGLDVLGGGTHDINQVTVTEVFTAADSLNRPSDCEFHPTEDELWVTNRGDDSIVVAIGIQTAPTASRRWTQSDSNHFLAKPSALAFGQAGTFATIHEEDELTQGPLPFGTPEDFMGPTLWESDSATFSGAHENHLDMLHNTPNGQGIAWDSGNAYWVFDGWHASITFYDFRGDHGLGGTDHRDGQILRYVEGDVGYVEGVSSHVALDPTSGLLYIADSGNSRVVTLDTTAGSVGGPIGLNYDGLGMGDMNEVTGVSLTTLIDATAGLVTPSGLELHDGMIWVADNDTATVYAFDMTGVVVDWLETGFGAGALQGMCIDDDGDVWIVDGLLNRVVEISP